MKLQHKLKTLPVKPGVYLFKDAPGNIIYIGKAKVLKNRVRSYFSPLHSLPRQGGGIKGGGTRTDIMISQIADLDYIVVSSELESLILENILIKQHKPRFNVLLRDDKNYQFIKLDYSGEIPQIYAVRKISPPHEEGLGEVMVGEKAKFTKTPSHSPSRGGERRPRYFGPYTSGLAVRNTLQLIKRIFRLCRNKKIGTKPCFAYHLGRCPGVCIGQISSAEYRKTFAQIERFLAHRQTEVLGFLKKEMREAAAAKKFEKAAKARDSIRDLEHLWERQLIISPKNEDQDFLGLYQTQKQAVVNVFMVRNGRLTGQENFAIEHEDSPDAEILKNFIMQYYSEGLNLPKEIFVPVEIEDASIIEKALSSAKGGSPAKGGHGASGGKTSKVKITKPLRGKKRKLLRMSAENAQIFFDRELTSFEKRLVHVLPDLRNLLNLPTIPRRIEGYDISNIQGTNPVGSMVVFADARPAKSEYRKFKINIKQTPDDFAMMREMLERRFRYLREFLPLVRGRRRGGHSQLRPPLTPPHEEGKKPWPLPDLIIIDGGKGQLNVAMKVLEKYNLSPCGERLPVIGLAKRLEEIFIPGEKKPIILPPDSPILFLLQQIRDEAHRFAVTFHRGRRGKLQTRSRLDDIPGIGPATRKKLIKKFGSAAALKRASLENIAEVVGEKLTKRIKEQL